MSNTINGVLVSLGIIIFGFAIGYYCVKRYLDKRVFKEIEDNCPEDINLPQTKPVNFTEDCDEKLRYGTDLQDKTGETNIHSQQEKVILSPIVSSPNPPADSPNLEEEKGGDDNGKYDGQGENREPTTTE